MTDTPEIRVPVIDSQGNPGTIPQSQVADAVFKDKAFTLAPVSPLKPQDIGKDGRVNVVDPTTGALGTIPLDQLQGALKIKSAQGGGFMLQSQYDAFNSPEVQKNIELIKGANASGEDWKRQLNQIFNDSDPMAQGGYRETEGPQAARELQRNNRNLHTVDPDHNFSMIDDHGRRLGVPIGHIDQARAAGYKFLDPKFQALYDAHIALSRDPSTSNQLLSVAGNNHTAMGLLGSVPLIGTGAKALVDATLSDPSTNNLSRAEELAAHSPEAHAGYAGAETLGTVVGVGAQLLAPEGLLGEVALAGKAVKAVKAAKILEDAPVIASVLGHAAQGAIIAAPQAADALINKNPKLAAESLGLGLLGGVILGELPNALNAGGRKLAQYAEGRLPAAADKALGSLGAEQSVLNAELKTKQQITDSLLEAGLKDNSSAQGTLKVLNEVSSGSKISVLGKLDAVAEERIITSQLSSDINLMVRGEGGVAKLSPELEGALNSLNQKMERMFPQGEGTLEQVQKLAGELSADLTKVRTASEVNNFNVQARDMLMNEIYRVGDQAALKADAKTIGMWGEQKAVAKAAEGMQSGFAAQIDAAERLVKGPLTQNLKDQIVEGGIKHLFHGAGVAIGHHVVPVIGGFVGGKIANSITEDVMPFLKKILPDTSSKSWLLKNAENPNLSSYVAMNAIHNTNVSVAQIPEFIKNPAIKTALFMNHPDPVKNLLGDSANGLSKSQQFDRLSSKVSLLAGNEQLRNQYLDSLASVMAKNHPELAAGLKAELNNKIMATNQLLHSGNSAQPQAFQTPQKYTPSKEKMAEIEAGLNAIQNPYSILSGLKDGKVSQKQVALVQQVHPAIYQEMTQQLIKEAYSGKTKLDYQQRLAVSKITGQPMDPSLKIGADLQKAYGPVQTGEPQGAPAPSKKKGGNSHSIKPSTVAGYTSAQRITGGK